MNRSWFNYGWQAASVYSVVSRQVQMLDSWLQISSRATQRTQGTKLSQLEKVWYADRVASLCGRETELGEFESRVLLLGSLTHVFWQWMRGAREIICSFIACWQSKVARNVLRSTPYEFEYDFLIWAHSYLLYFCLMSYVNDHTVAVQRVLVMEMLNFCWCVFFVNSSSISIYSSIAYPCKL